ncbi:MAG TPA: DUF309 domain-containing protein [Acidobacteriota bacterium]|nr:DUF309 domain-containing protein [bacterium]HNX19601.1 DUF309 domain-containing protein [Acidobacteriota bacterium]
MAGTRILPAGMRRGVALFNEGRYYAAHEEMELAWRATLGEERLFYQGLIQAAVALWRVTRGDATIALTMVCRALPKLRQFAPEFRGLDVARLVNDLLYVRDQLLALGEAHVAEFDPRQLPRLHGPAADERRRAGRRAVFGGVR